MQGGPGLIQGNTGVDGILKNNNQKLCICDYATTEHASVIHFKNWENIKEDRFEVWHPIISKQIVKNIAYRKHITIIIFRYSLLHFD